MKKRRKISHRIIRILAACFVIMNAVAFFHAYKFTHFTDQQISKTQSPEKLNAFSKLKTLLLGVNNPRPVNSKKPLKYSDILLQSNKTIACWYLNTKDSHTTDTPKGTIILFHGYSGAKSSMLDKADEFEKLGYNILLVDFMGSGGSEGNQTTLGFKEAAQVKTAFDYLAKQGEKNIYLFGTSMGAVAIKKAVADYDLKPAAIILECPFGSMYKTTCARFKIMNAPTFPMAGLLVFWGGVQNGFWAFGHKPTEYAKKIDVPTLLLYGEQDKNVSRQEIDDIYRNLAGKKILRTYKTAGHENYLTKYKDQWIKDLKAFLEIH